MAEINLLNEYPKSQRPIEERGRRKLAREGRLMPRTQTRSNSDIILEQRLLNIAREFGEIYFDGDRLYGYGGYYYDPRFWTATVKRFVDHYMLGKKSSILDVGCAKGFLLYDFLKYNPDFIIAGLDISEYAKEHAVPEIKPFISIGNAKKLPYADNSFDLVISINTIDHLPPDECKKALQEIMRVSRKNAFVSVNAWRNDIERELLAQWNITALTSMHIDDWKVFFHEADYTGDFYWFTLDVKTPNADIP